MSKPRDIERLHDELEQLFDDFWRLPRFFAGPRRGFKPGVDVFRTDDPPQLNVVVDLAGVDPDDVHLALSDRMLVIAGQRPRQHPDCPRAYYQLEIENGVFERRISLPESVDASEARATYERGLLTIVLPVAERSQTGLKASIPVRREP
jgi:HSP20 family protein